MSLARIICLSWLLALTVPQAHGGSIEPDVQFSLSDTLVVDANDNGVAEPGDTLQYQGRLTNVGNLIGLAAQVELTPGTGATLVPGTVHISDHNASNGHVLIGNSTGDTDVLIFLGTLSAGGGSAEFSLQARIDEPLPDGTISVSTQGEVTGANFTRSLSIDPDHSSADGATVTPVQSLTPQPQLAATLNVVPGQDINGNRRLDGTEVAQVSVAIRNIGDVAAHSVQYRHRLPAALLANDGTAEFSADLGILAPGEITQLDYQLNLQSDLRGSKWLSLQGLVSAADHATVLTSDPLSPDAALATPLAVHGAPIAVPTSNVWSLCLLSALMLLSGFWLTQRRTRPGSGH